MNTDEAKSIDTIKSDDEPISVGYNPTERDRELVLSLVGCGIPNDRICRFIINPRTKKPISKATLYKFFRHEIETGADVANSAVAKNLFRLATGDGRGAVTAAIFWLKTRARWKEPPDEQLINLVDKNGTSLIPAVEFVYPKQRSDTNEPPEKS